MSWLVTAIVATGVTGAVSARASYVAGKAQEIAYKQQAEQEKLRAESEELQRRQELNKSLASSTLSMAAGGVAGEGSPLSLALASAKQASISEGVIGVSEKLKQAQLRRQGANAAAMGKLQAASTLLQTGASMATIAKGD